MSTSPPLVVADRYRLVAPLGQGGMGRVWRATDVVLHREVAIKELVPPPGLTADERREMRERSLREARAIARLNNINVVRVFDVLRTDADPWIVMEYVPSKSLQDILASDGPCTPTRAAEIGLGVLNALRAAHHNGVMHRDVKPGNVLIGEDGRVVLTDFGLATLPGNPDVTRTGLVLGSPAYIAPERARDGTAGPGADLWSLGATLYAAVEGQSPFARPSAIATLAALATENPPPARNAGPLKPVLNGLLRKDPSHRINAVEAERLLNRAAGRKSRLSLPMSPTMRRPGVGRDRTSSSVPPVVPGATPVVPGPRPPVSRPQTPPAARSQTPPAARSKAPQRPQQPPPQGENPGGRPVFAPGKAVVGRPPTDTPTRVDGPRMDQTKIENPSGTRSAPKPETPGRDGPPASTSGPNGALARGTRGSYGAIPQPDVPGTRGRATTPPAAKAAPATRSSSPETEAQAEARLAAASDAYLAAQEARRTKLVKRTGAKPPVRPDDRPTRVQPAVPAEPAPDATAKADATTKIQSPAETKVQPAIRSQPASGEDQTKLQPAVAAAAPIAAPAKSEDDVEAAAEPAVEAGSADTTGNAPEEAAELQPAVDAEAAPETVEPEAAEAEPALGGAEAKVAADPDTSPEPTVDSEQAADPDSEPSEAATKADTAAEADEEAETATTADTDAATPVEVEVAEAEPAAPADVPEQPDAAEGRPSPEAEQADEAPADPIPAETAMAATPEIADKVDAKPADKPAVEAPAGTKPARRKNRARANPEPVAVTETAEPVEAETPAEPTTALRLADTNAKLAAAEVAAAIDAGTNSEKSTTENTRNKSQPKSGKTADSKATTASMAAPKTGKADRAGRKSKETAAGTAVIGVPTARTSATPSFSRSSRPAWQPMNFVPPRPVGGLTVFGVTLTRRQTMIGIAILAVVVLLLAVLIPVAFAGGGDDENQGKGPEQQPAAKPSAAAVAPPSVASEKPAATTPQKSATATKPAATPATAALPPGWTLYKDDTGFQIPLPMGFVRDYDQGTEVYFRDNTGANRLLIVDQTDSPRPDPRADWAEKESQRQLAGYQRIRLANVTGFFQKAGDWEYLYTTDQGNPYHAQKRGVVINSHKAYGISWFTQAGDWAANKKNLDTIYRGFKPA